MFAISRKILTLPGFSYESLQGGATDFAKLVNMTPITMAYGRCNEPVHWVKLNQQICNVLPKHLQMGN